MVAINTLQLFTYALCIIPQKIWLSPGGLNPADIRIREHPRTTADGFVAAVETFHSRHKMMQQFRLQRLAMPAWARGFARSRDALDIIPNSNTLVA
jgi:hypothetical protein